MPLYEYECEKCHKVFEVIQKFSDTPLSVHEDCGGTLKRLISTSALQFKGSGWYVTDYAGKGGNGSKKTESSDSKSTTESSTKSESKPADTKSSSSDTSSSKSD